jgi:hypothetical protein
MNTEPFRPFRRRTILRATAAILLVLLAALVWRGHVYPVLPKSLVAWWVQRVVPLGSSISEARTAATRHGWRVTNHGGPCVAAAPKSTFLTVELGSLWLLLPAVSYSFASLCFDDAGRLQSITVTREIDAP